MFRLFAGLKAYAASLVDGFLTPRSPVGRKAMFRTLVTHTLRVFIIFIVFAAALSFAPQPVAASDQAARLYYELTDAPTIAVDWNNGTMQSVVLAGDRKFTFTGGQPGGRYLLSITQDAHGSRTVTWPADVRAPGGGPVFPTLTTTANRTDYIGFVYSGRSKTYDMLSISSDY